MEEVWKIEVVMSSKKAAHDLLSLILSETVEEMLDRRGGKILAAATLELPKEGDEKSEEDDDGEE